MYGLDLEQEAKSLQDLIVKSPGAQHCGSQFFSAQNLEHYLRSFVMVKTMQLPICFGSSEHQTSSIT